MELAIRRNSVSCCLNVAMFGMTALALQDAFLVDLGWGWRLVEGIRQGA